VTRTTPVSEGSDSRVIGARELMRFHVQALFTFDEAGRLVAVNVRGGAVAPRFFLGCTAEGNVWWFRHDLGPALIDDLTTLCEQRSATLDRAAEPAHAVPFITRLSRDDPIRGTWMGPAFRFPSDLPGHPTAIRVTSENASVLSPYLEDWRDDVSGSAPMAVVLEAGKAVSVCCSVRITTHAHEAGVETHPDFRGRGHAARAVSGWARAVREMNRIPLYSTSWTNEPSRALARKIGLIQYGADLHIT